MTSKILPHIPHYDMNALITTNCDLESIKRFENDLEMDVKYHSVGVCKERFPPENVRELRDGVGTFVVGYRGILTEMMHEVDLLRLIDCPRGSSDASINTEAVLIGDVPKHIANPGTVSSAMSVGSEC